MREAVGGGYLLNVVIVIVSVVMLFFVGILSYSKAYRTKNRIIEIIEEYEGYEAAVDMISTDLNTMGYSAVANKKCSSDNLNKTNYNYCVYYSNSANNGSYYKVVTYVHFDVPIIGGLINIPVKGETKILGKKYND